MPSRLTHICLHVKDLKDCVSFYTDYCGLHVLQDNSVEGEGSVYMAEADQQSGIVLQLKSGGESLSLADNDDSHLGFSVDTKQAVDDLANRARNENLLFFEPDEYLPGSYICAVKDPNGNCVEFGYAHPLPST